MRPKYIKYSKYVLPAVVEVESSKCHGAKKARGQLGIPKGGETKAKAISSKVPWDSFPPAPSGAALRQNS